jgi:hypothetical protein
VSARRSTIAGSSPAARAAARSSAFAQGLFALRQALGQGGEQADLARQRPADQHRLHSLPLQPAQDARAACGVAGERAVDQGEDVVPGAVGHRFHDVRLVDRPRPAQQQHLFDLLHAGEEVALHAPRQRRRRRGRRLHAARAHALGNPAGQLRRRGRPELEQDAAALQGGEPLGGLGRLVRARQADQQQIPLHRPFGVLGQRPRARLAGLAARHAQLDEPLRREQRHPRRRLRQFAPVETGLDAECHAFAIALRARRGADGVAGLLQQQRLVPAYQVDRGQPAGEVAVQLFRPEFHGAAPASTGPGASGRIACRRIRTWRMTSYSMSR